MTASEQIDILEPFIEITSMVNEIINLEYEAVGGNIKISEKKVIIGKIDILLLHMQII